MNLTVLLGLFAVAAAPMLPIEPVLIGLGTLAAAGHQSPLPLVAVAAAGCTVSDHIIYVVGRCTGTRALSRMARWRSTAATTAWLVRQFDRWATAVLVAGRWLPGGGIVAALLAGATSRGLRWFTPVSVLGSSLWAGYATMLGYVGGSLMHQPVAGMAVSLLLATVVALLARVATPRRAAGRPPVPEPAARP